MIRKRDFLHLQKELIKMQEILNSLCESLFARIVRQDERMTDVEKDIKLTWDNLGVTKEVIPAKEKEYKLSKKK
jgi:hypothetical protein